MIFGDALITPYTDTFIWISFLAILGILYIQYQYDTGR